jgi:hypothetical protein
MTAAPAFVRENCARLMPLRRRSRAARNIELLRAAVSFKEATVWGVTIHRTGARAAVLRQPAALFYCVLWRK